MLAHHLCRTQARKIMFRHNRLFQKGQIHGKTILYGVYKHNLCGVVYWFGKYSSFSWTFQMNNIICVEHDEYGEPHRHLKNKYIYTYLCNLVRKCACGRSETQAPELRKLKYVCNKNITMLYELKLIMLYS